MAQARPEDILKSHWGFNGFRQGQKEIVNSILQGNNTLALLPTGGGKSVCFQVPGLILGGLTIVVSPLIALMKDQVDGLHKINVDAAFLNSGQTYKEQRIIMENALQGHYRFLYVSPERLAAVSFQEYLPNLDVKLLVIDEAHCISMWGADFRPSFRKIPEIYHLFVNKPVIAAFTASAPHWIQEDVVKGLQLSDVQVHQGDFGRANLKFRSYETTNKMQYLVQGLKNSKGCSIVFGGTRKIVKDVAAWLNNEGITAHYYHGGLDRDARMSKQQAWIENKVRVMVCTNAFGMGVDKPDVRQVFHLSPSPTPEDYYQEAGRAGRDGNTSYCILFHDKRDWIRAEDFIEKQHPSEKTVIRVYHAIMNSIGVSPGSGEGQSYPLPWEQTAKKYNIPTTDFFYSLQVLEKLGYLTLSDGLLQSSRIMFTADYTEVYDFKIRYAAFQPIIDLLLRTYGGVFERYVSVNEWSLSKGLFTTVEEIEVLLNKLKRANMLDYSPRNNDPVVTLLEPRSMYPRPKLDFLKELKNRKLSALSKIKEYAFTSNCRSRFWVEYFTEKQSIDCGNCDNCNRTSTNTHSQIQSELLTLLKDKEWDFFDFVESVPLERKEEYISALDTMIDLGLVTKTDSNTLICQRQK